MLAERVKAKLRPDQNYVIDSIRNPSEVAALRANGDFHLLRVDAPPEVRYERVVNRGGDRKPVSREEFVEQERREMEKKAATPRGSNCGPASSWLTQRS